jgi:hypothetical protein
MGGLTAGSVLAAGTFSLCERRLRAKVGYCVPASVRHSPRHPGAVPHCSALRTRLRRPTAGPPPDAPLHQLCFAHARIFTGWGRACSLRRRLAVSRRPGWGPVRGVRVSGTHATPPVHGLMRARASVQVPRRFEMCEDPFGTGATPPPAATAAPLSAAAVAALSAAADAVPVAAAKPQEVAAATAADATAAPLSGTAIALAKLASEEALAKNETSAADTAKASWLSCGPILPCMRPLCPQCCTQMWTDSSLFVRLRAFIFKASAPTPVHHLDLSGKAGAPRMPQQLRVLTCPDPVLTRP